MKTPLTQHVEEWGTCTRCELSQQRSLIVLGHGSVPCDILFIGEAPGVSEDALGQAFVGEAGHLLDDIVETALDDSGLRVAFTNLVACFPREAKQAGTNAPDEDCIEACKPRLESFIRVTCPRLVVAVGKLAETWMAQGFKHSVRIPQPMGEPRAKVVHIDHPAYIIRANYAQRSLLRQRAIAVLRQAIRGL